MKQIMGVGAVLLAFMFMLWIIGGAGATPDEQYEEETGNVPPGKDKVAICHKPGTPAESTLYVPPTAVPGHLGHGDTLGECGQTTPPEETTVVPPDEPTMVEPTDVYEPTVAEPTEPTMVEPTVIEPTEPTVVEPTVVEPTMVEPTEPTVVEPTEPTNPGGPDNPPDTGGPDKPDKPGPKPDRPDNPGDKPGDNVVVIVRPGVPDLHVTVVNVTGDVIVVRNDNSAERIVVQRVDLDGDGVRTNVEERAMIVAGVTEDVGAVRDNAAATPAQAIKAVEVASAGGASALPDELPETGGPAILAPAAAVFAGSVILVYAMLRRAA